MKKKSNALVYILLFLITICLAGGIVGLMAKKSGINNNPNNKNKFFIKILYNKVKII